jgi:hypothetical protein
MDPKAARVSSHLALAVYAESLAERGHVTVIGDSSLGLGPLLVRLGARAVEVWDPDGPRARSEAELAPSGVTVRWLSKVHAEATNVDLVVIPDLGCFSEPTEILARVRRMVGDEGAALVVAANRDVAANEGSRAFDYYELFDLVAKEFDCVRMIAQLPFHGVTLAELGEEDQSPTVNVDTQLADTTRSAEAFIALASQRDVRLDAYSIVELPAHPAPPASDTVSAGAREALEEAELRSRALETQNAELTARAADRDRLAEAVAALERVLLERSEAAEQLAVVLDDRTRKLAQVERRTVVLEQELHRTDAQPDEHIRFEEALRERARAVQQLEAELARRDQMVRELAGALEEAAVAEHPVPEVACDEPDPDAEENARLRERLDSLALDLARREGEAHASAWKVAELERRLAQGTPMMGNGPGPVAQLSAALDEVEALRRALVQEHEARVRAEALGASGAVQEDNSR